MPGFPGSPVFRSAVRHLAGDWHITLGEVDRHTAEAHVLELAWNDPFRCREINTTGPWYVTDSSRSTSNMDENCAWWQFSCGCCWTGMCRPTITTLTLLLRVVVHELYTISHASRRRQDCSCAVAYTEFVSMYWRRSLLATFFFCKHSRQLDFLCGVGARTT